MVLKIFLGRLVILQSCLVSCLHYAFLVLRMIYDFFLLAPRPQYQENAAWVIRTWPYVVLRVFRFGLKFGMAIGFLLFLHILHTLHSHPDGCLCLRILCAQKALLWLPAPYFCLKKSLQLDAAESALTADEVGVALVHIIESSRWRDRIMLILLYIWIGASMFFTFSSDDAFSRSLWYHGIYATFFVVFHRIVCAFLFVYWSQGNVYAPMSSKQLERCSSILTVVTAKTFKDGATQYLVAEDEDCSVCYCDFEVNDKLRKLPCNHVFHKECVDPWLLNRFKRCPLCQRNPEQYDNVPPSKSKIEAA